MESISRASATDVYGAPLQAWFTSIRLLAIIRSRTDIHGKHICEAFRFRSVEFVLGFDDTTLCSSVHYLSIRLNPARTGDVEAQ